MRIWLLVLAACGNGPTSPAPIANVAPAPAIPKPACVPADRGFQHATIAEGAIRACYAADAGDDECWRFEMGTRTWRFEERRPSQPYAEPMRPVTATARNARVCRPDGTDCRRVPLSGVVAPPPPDDELTATANADRSIVAVWPRWGNVYAFDAAGKRLATIKPWPTDMSGSDPSVFRDAHVLGDVLEVRISDTPISAAIRLYDARTGKPIADVNKAGSMDDQLAPVELGGTRYAFLTIGDRSIVIVDVATGRELGRYPIGDETLGETVATRVPGGLAGVVATRAFVIDDRGRIIIEQIPAC